MPQWHLGCFLILLIVLIIAVRVCRPVKGAGQKLKVQLGDVVSMLHDMAADPQAWQGRPRGSAGAAWLSSRELVSSFQTLLSWVTCM